jgi:hypothetical protein
MFNERVGGAAGLKAQEGSKIVPFFVMCGSLDMRYDIAQIFARRLQESGYQVETIWPRTPHGSRNSEAFKSEFEKYSRTAVEFFLRVTNKN